MYGVRFVFQKALRKRKVNGLILKNTVRKRKVYGLNLKTRYGNVK